MLTALWLIIHLDLTTRLPSEGNHLVLGRDFLNFWMYGRAAFDVSPERYYDVDTYLAALDAVLGPGFFGQMWSYPPTLMLFAAPFGLIGYGHALAIWTTGSVTLLVAALRLWSRSRLVILASVFAPPATFALLSGQASLLIAAALMTAFKLLDRRPIIAGILIGLLTVKPQVGLLIPVFLCVTGRWRVFCAAALTAGAMVALVALLWGPHIWWIYLTQGIINQLAVLRDPQMLAGPFMPTIFVNLREIGLSYPGAMMVQSGVALAMAGIVATAFWGKRQPLASEDLALLFAASVLTSAYLMAYDTLPLAIASALMLMMPQREPMKLILAFGYFLLDVQFALGSLKLPGAALIPLGLVVFLLINRRQILTSNAFSPQEAEAAATGSSRDRARPA